jgi:hypothetical protein
MYPLLESIDKTVESNARQITNLTKIAEEIPAKTASILTSSINAGMEAVAQEIAIFRAQYEQYIQDQTARIETALITNANIISKSITQMSEENTVALHDLNIGLNQSIETGFTQQSTALNAIRSTIETELQRIGESEQLYKDAMILFVTEYWVNYETLIKRMSRVTVEGVKTTVADAAEVTTKLKEPIVSVVSGGRIDDKDYLAEHEKARFEATGEMV